MPARTGVPVIPLPALAVRATPTIRAAVPVFVQRRIAREGETDLHRRQHADGTEYSDPAVKKAPALVRQRVLVTPAEVSGPCSQQYRRMPACLPVESVSRPAHIHLDQKAPEKRKGDGLSAAARSTSKLWEGATRLVALRFAFNRRRSERADAHEDRAGLAGARVRGVGRPTRAARGRRGNRDA